MNAETRSDQSRCPHCNALIPATSRICVMCGQTQTWATDIPDEDLAKAQQHLIENPPTPQKLETRIFWSIGIIALFIITLPFTLIITAFLFILTPIAGYLPLGLAGLAAAWFLWDIWKPSK